MKPIHIFRAGQHTAASGEELNFSQTDLAAIAAAYDPATHEAPIVIGHPASNGPAYGWVEKVEFGDDGLTAIPDQLDPEFEQMVEAGRFKKVSASFYKPGSVNNPTPGTYHLRHVGFLGAQPPAVKGLRAVAFSDDDIITVEFAETTNNPIQQKTTEKEPEMAAKDDTDKLAKLAERESAAAKKETELAERESATAKAEQDFAERKARAEATEFIEKNIAEGKVLPKDAKPLAEFIAGLEANEVVEFGEDAKMSPQAWFHSFIEELPKQVDFSEASKSDGEEVDLNDPRAVADKAVAYRAEMRGKGVAVSTTAAVQYVTKGVDQ